MIYEKGDVQMAAAYVRIKCDRGTIRTYGGNTSDVRNMILRYKKMSLGDFMFKHQHLTQHDYNTLAYEFVKKK